MRIIARPRLKTFAEKHADAKPHLDTWWQIASKSDWASPNDIKDHFPKASIIADNRVVFNIKGGSYRLIVKFNYQYRMGYIRFIGTHADYDAIDAEEV